MDISWSILISMYSQKINNNLAPWLRGITQKKSFICEWLLLLYFPKTYHKVRIFNSHIKIGAKLIPFWKYLPDNWCKKKIIQCMKFSHLTNSDLVYITGVWSLGNLTQTFLHLTWRQDLHHLCLNPVFPFSQIGFFHFSLV